MSSTIMHSFAVFLLCSTVYAQKTGNDEAKDDLVYTPHGMRPRECVIFHNESEVILNPISTGVWANYPKSGTRKFFPAKPECVENSIKILADFFKEKTEEPEEVQFAVTTKTQIKIGGRNFSAYIAVPDENLPALNNGMIGYWTGLSSSQQQPNNQSAALLQPVVAWCSSGECDANPRYENAWQYASWQCCPHGGTHRAGPNYKATIGENIWTYAYSDPSSGNTEVYMKGKEGVSSLKSTVNHMNHDIFTMVLEIHDMEGVSCDHFNTKPCIFTQLKIDDNNGKNVDMTGLDWSYSDKNDGCNGAGKWISPTSFQIVAAK
eukprot:389979_1